MTSQAVEDRVIGCIGVAIIARIGTPVIFGEPGMIESGSSPLRGCVTDVTRCRELRRRVVRIGGLIIKALMARVTVGRRARILTANMTVCTGNSRVRSGQLKGGLA